MYGIKLDDAALKELDRRARTAGTMPRTRTRLEMVRLANAGWEVAQIAGHFRVCERTVRTWLKAYQRGGFDALPDQPHLGQKSALTPALVEAIRQRLRQDDRNWTAPQLAEWLAEEHGVRFRPYYLSRRLRRAKLSYKRTHRSLKHKQDPEEVARKQAQLAELEKGGPASARPGTR